MEPTAPLTASMPPVLWFVLVAAGLTWLVTRPRVARQALHLVASKPAYLVPAAMSVVGIALVAWVGPHPDRFVIHENPFTESAHGSPPLAGWIGLFVVGIALAGLVGLLEAHAEGREANSDAFRAGVRRHAAAILLAKLAAAGLTAGVLNLIDPSGRNAVLLVLCLVPSLALAPVLGATSLHPGRPFAALAEALRIVQREMWGVGRLVTAEAALLIGLFAMWGRTIWPGGAAVTFDDLFVWHPALLAHDASALSFNHFPFVLGTLDRFASGLAVLAAAFGSTVFVAAHFLGATRGYDNPAPIEVPEEDVPVAS